MVRHRGFWAIAALAVGTLQAWDSGIFTVSIALQAVALAAIALPATLIALPAGQRTRLVALIVAGIVLAIVRVQSPVSLNTLHLALWVPVIYVCFVERWLRAANEPA